MLVAESALRGGNFRDPVAAPAASTWQQKDLEKANQYQHFLHLPGSNRWKEAWTKTPCIVPWMALMGTRVQGLLLESGTLLVLSTFRRRFPEGEHQRSQPE